jgi:hypothetical protein
LQSSQFGKQLPQTHILEIGPGPILANGIRFIAAGAASYTALERYNLFRTDEAVRSVYLDLIDSLPPEERKRCEGLIGDNSNTSAFDQRIQMKKLCIEEASHVLAEAS